MLNTNPASQIFSGAFNLMKYAIYLAIGCSALFMVLVIFLVSKELFNEVHRHYEPRDVIARDVPGYEALWSAWAGECHRRYRESRNQHEMTDWYEVFPHDMGCFDPSVDDLFFEQRDHLLQLHRSELWDTLLAQWRWYDQYTIISPHVRDDFFATVAKAGGEERVRADCRLTVTWSKNIEQAPNGAHNVAGILCGEEFFRFAY